MYEALGNMGLRQGNILEPSCGVGNFMGLLPESMNHTNMYGVELDPVSGQIAKQLYQKTGLRYRDLKKQIIQTAFSTVWLEMYRLELIRSVTGNMTDTIL